MQQLSRPYQIALGLFVLLAIAWFTVLKPSDAASADAGALPPTVPAAAPAPTPAAGGSVPGAAGLGRAVAKAEAAKDTANATAGAAAASDPGAAPAPSAAAPRAAKPSRSATAAKPAAALPDEDPSAPVLDDVARGKIAVLLFFSPEAADDLAVRRALRHADRHGGRVVVRTASIARIADYAAITAGIQVTQAPSLLVIGAGGHTRMLVGYTDTASIDQLVEDVGGAAFAARRLKGYPGRIQNLCAVVGQSLESNATPGADLGDRLGVLRSDLADARRTVARLHTPHRYAAFRRRFSADLGVLLGATKAAQAAKVSGGDPAATLHGFDARAAAAGAKVRAAARAAGLPAGC